MSAIPDKLLERLNTIATFYDRSAKDAAMDAARYPGNEEKLKEATKCVAKSDLSHSIIEQVKQIMTAYTIS